jgi:hypothetical protein
MVKRFPFQKVIGLFDAFTTHQPTLFEDKTSYRSRRLENVSIYQKNGRTKMRLKPVVRLMIIIISMTILGLPACNLLGTGEPSFSAEELAQTAVAETMAVEHNVQTIVAGTLAASGELDADGPEATEVPEPSTPTPEPTITLTPTIVVTPTPDKPMVSVSVNTNCRTGPGLQYQIVGALLVGEQAEVVGVAENGDYWIIKNPRGPGECWLWGQYASVAGQTSGLPRLTPPPTPTPTFTPTPAYNWTGTWTTSFGVTGFPHENYVINLTQDNASVSGSFTVGTNVVSLNGTLSADYMILTGTWSDSFNSGPFEFKLVSMDQFIGNRDNRDYEWCGYREGAGLPSPCLGP